MSKGRTDGSAGASSSRRDFLKKSVAAAAASVPLSAGDAVAQGTGRKSNESAGNKPPNVVVIIADQFRGDFIGANGRNPMGVTPNLDAMAERGVTMLNAVTNQPLCSPCSRLPVYGPLRHRNRDVEIAAGSGTESRLPTLASVLRSHGYTANYIGKWHLAPIDRANHKGLGFVEPQDRGGFLDLWQASNVIELTSHPYEGTIWDGDGKPMHYKDVYRVDYLTDLAVRFLKQRHEKPFLLVLSQLEPHFQNDANAFVPPKGYIERYQNPFAPKDLRFFPGDWQAQLPGYYGDIKRIDESVGTVMKTLAEENLENNTIVLFISDHGCHFRTRNTEYKRSPHESSIHIPLIMQGPGLNRSRKVSEVVSMVDVTPTLLDAAGVPAPASMKGRSFMPLINRPKGRASWRNEAFVQISASMVARALRTDQWTYCVVDPTGNGDRDPHSTHYQEYQMYNLAADPHQLLNLAGRKDPPHLVHYDGDRPLPEVAAHLRERLIARMVEAGEPRAEIEERHLYP